MWREKRSERSRGRWQPGLESFPSGYPRDHSPPKHSPPSSDAPLCPELASPLSPRLGRAILPYEGTVRSVGLELRAGAHRERDCRDSVAVRDPPATGRGWYATSERNLP